MFTPGYLQLSFIVHKTKRSTDQTISLIAYIMIRVNRYTARFNEPANLQCLIFITSGTISLSKVRDPHYTQSEKKNGRGPSLTSYYAHHSQFSKLTKHPFCVLPKTLMLIKNRHGEIIVTCVTKIYLIYAYPQSLQLSFLGSSPEEDNVLQKTRGTFVCSFVHSCFYLCVPPPATLVNFPCYLRKFYIFFNFPYYSMGTPYFFHFSLISYVIQRGIYIFFSFSCQFFMLFTGCFCNFVFLVADMQLYMRFCVSICPSVGLLVRPFVRGDQVEKWNSSCKSVRWSGVPVPRLSRLYQKLKGKQGSGPKGVNDLCFHTYVELLFIIVMLR